MRTAGSRARGFTLVEVLVALFIMAVMAGMSWQGVDAVLRTREVAQARIERLLRFQTVMAQWESDILQVIDTHTVPALKREGPALRLTRRHPQGVQLVVWWLRSGHWQRWNSVPTTNATELQEAWMRSYQLTGTENASVDALTGLADWEIYYLDGNSVSNAQSSGDVVSAAAATTQGQQFALPEGVRLTLSFAEGAGLSGSYTRDLLLAPHAKP